MAIPAKITKSFLLSLYRRHGNCKTMKSPAPQPARYATGRHARFILLLNLDLLLAHAYPRCSA
jgi:hypothetical protein